jgi:hypothetical protein
VKGCNLLSRPFPGEMPCSTVTSTLTASVRERADAAKGYPAGSARRSGGLAGPRLGGSLGGLVGRRVRRLARRRVSSAGRLGGLDARLERSHHVDDRGLLGLDRRQLELLAGGLATDQAKDLDPIVVLVLVRIELGAERPNQYFPQKLLSVGS